LTDDYAQSACNSSSSCYNVTHQRNAGVSFCFVGKKLIQPQSPANDWGFFFACLSRDIIHKTNSRSIHVRSLVNIASLVVNSDIRTEVIEGVNFTVIPSKTLPKDVVMNSILYPSEEVEAAISTLDMSPVTIGHPVVNGKFAPASDPISQAAYGILGAHNRVKGKTDDGRWVVEKLIPTEQLQNTERGKKLAEAIKHKRPIHTSTGVYLTKEPEIGVNAMGQEYTSRAKIDRFDHDAILLNEVGAATPEQGVGIFVNAEGEQEETEVMYVNAYDDKQLEGQFEIKVKGSMLERFLEFMKTVVKSEPSDESQTVNSNREGNEVDETKVNEMIANALAAQEAKSAEVIKQAIDGAVASALAANAQTQAEAEKAQLVEQVVNAKLLPEDAAKECGVTALKAMLEGNSQGQPAMGLRRGVASNQDEDIFANYKIEG